MIDFLEKIKNPQTNIKAMINRDLQEQIENNRKILIPVIESLLYLARMGLAFRGTEEKGFRVPDHAGDLDATRGNFNNLMEARYSWGDSKVVKQQELLGGEFVLYFPI